MSGKSTFTQEIADIICERISNGESVRQISRDESMPSESTIYKWLADNDAFSEQYARAREAQADFFAEEILDIADYAERDWSPKKNESGEVIGIQVDGEAIQRSKLRVDTRKWLMSKMAPKKYGEKSSVELSGKDGGPIQAVVNVSIGSAQSQSS